MVAPGAPAGMTPPPRRPSPWRRREVRARIRRLPEPPARSVPTLVQPLHNGSSSPHPSRGTPPVPSFAVVHNRRKTARTKSFRGSSSIRDAKVGQGTFLFDSDEDERDDDRGLTGGTGEIAIAKSPARRTPIPSRPPPRTLPSSRPLRGATRSRAPATNPAVARTPLPAFDHPSTPSYSATACDANVLEARGPVVPPLAPGKPPPGFESRSRRATEKRAKTRRRWTRTRSRVPPRDATLRRCPRQLPCATFANGSRRSFRRVPRNPRPGV